METDGFGGAALPEQLRAGAHVLTFKIMPA